MMKKNKKYVKSSNKNESNLSKPNNYKIKGKKISTDKNTRTILKQIQRKDLPKNTSVGKNDRLETENSKGRNKIDGDKNFSSLMNLTMGSSFIRDKFNHDSHQKTYVEIYNTNLSRKKKPVRLRVASNDLYYNNYTLDDTNNFPESNINSSTNIENNKKYQRTNYSQQKRKRKIKIIDNLSKKGNNKPKNNISCIVINSGRHKNVESNDKLI
jgi:disulfide oxidoreductase YuzD